MQKKMISMNKKTAILKYYDGNRKIGNINDFEYELLSLVTGYDYDEDTANDYGGSTIF